MKHIIAMIMTLSVFANLAFAEQERVSREEWRIGVGGFYTKQDFPVFNSNSVSSFGDMSAYGGYIIGVRKTRAVNINSTVLTSYVSQNPLYG